jgi:hypothetical protein
MYQLFKNIQHDASLILDFQRAPTGSSHWLATGVHRSRAQKYRVGMTLLRPSQGLHN